MADREGMGSGFTTKQKAMAAGVVIILLVVIWQIMGLFGGGSTEEANAPVTPAQQQPTAAAAKPAAQMQMARGAAPNAIPTPAPVVPQPQAMQPKEPAGLSNSELLKNQQEQQKEFLTSVNELQMLKLQRDIAETNQAIAAAKLATETTKKSISDLLAKPAPAPAVPAGNYASGLVNPAQPGVAVPSGPGGPESAPPLAAVPDSPPASYIVISVSMQMNRWTAVLGNSGKLYSVSVGDVLPADGWVVASISKAGVILKKDKAIRKISLVPAI